MPAEGASSNCIDETFTAENALTDYQYHIAELSGADQIDVSDGATDVPFGIIQNTPAASGGARIRLFGRSQCRVDANSTAIAAGDRIGLGSTNGHGYKVDSDKDEYIAIALGAATADDVLIDVFVVGLGYISKT